MFWSISGTNPKTKRKSKESLALSSMIKQRYITFNMDTDGQNLDRKRSRIVHTQGYLFFPISNMLTCTLILTL